MGMFDGIEKVSSPNKPTEKQMAYLHRLGEKLMADVPEDLTREGASELISEWESHLYDQEEECDWVDPLIRGEFGWKD